MVACYVQLLSSYHIQLLENVAGIFACFIRDQNTASWLLLDQAYRIPWFRSTRMLCLPFWTLHWDLLQRDRVLAWFFKEKKKRERTMRCPDPQHNPNLSNLTGCTSRNDTLFKCVNTKEFLIDNSLYYTPFSLPLTFGHLRHGYRYWHGFNQNHWRWTSNQTHHQSRCWQNTSEERHSYR